MVTGHRHRSGLVSGCLHRGRGWCRHSSPLQGLEDPSSSPSRRLRCRLAGGPRHPFHDARGRAGRRPRAPSAPKPPTDFASIDGAISYAQQSGFSIINLFTEHTPLSEYRDAVGAEIIYLVLSHIAEIDKNASITVSGSAIDGALTLSISALTAKSRVLAERRMGEIRALVDALNGTVETDEMISTWTLTADIPAAAGAPA